MVPAAASSAAMAPDATAPPSAAPQMPERPMFTDSMLGRLALDDSADGGPSPSVRIEESVVPASTLAVNGCQVLLEAAPSELQPQDITAYAYVTSSKLLHPLEHTPASTCLETEEPALGPSLDAAQSPSDAGLAADSGSSDAAISSDASSSDDSPRLSTAHGSGVETSSGSKLAPELTLADLSEAEGWHLHESGAWLYFVLCPRLCQSMIETGAGLTLAVNYGVVATGAR